MTRDHLEAVIWQHTAALSSPRVTDRIAAMDAVLDAVDDYTTAQCCIAIGVAPNTREQYERRRAMEAALGPWRKRKGAA